MTLNSEVSGQGCLHVALAYCPDVPAAREGRVYRLHGVKSQAIGRGNGMTLCGLLCGETETMCIGGHVAGQERICKRCRRDEAFNLRVSAFYSLAAVAFAVKGGSARVQTNKKLRGKKMNLETLKTATRPEIITAYNKAAALAGAEPFNPKWSTKDTYTRLKRLAESVDSVPDDLPFEPVIAVGNQAGFGTPLILGYTETPGGAPDLTGAAAQFSEEMAALDRACREAPAIAVEAPPSAAEAPTKKKRGRPRIHPIKPPSNMTRLMTKTVMAALKPGQILKHEYRMGVEPTIVKVLEPPDLEGKGGRFDCKGTVFAGMAGLREIIFRESGHAWNVLLFFRLIPYYKHAPKNKGGV